MNLVFENGCEIGPNYNAGTDPDIQSAVEPSRCKSHARTADAVNRKLLKPPARPKPRHGSSDESVSSNQSEFRERLRELIQEIGSEAELERRANLPVGMISHYTRTHPSDPSRAYLVKLALAAGVSIAWLAAGIGTKRDSK